MRQRSVKRLGCVVLAAPAAVAVGQTAPADQEQVVRLEVSPAAAPDPAFRYTLVTPVTQQVGGTAAPLYLNANDMLPQKVTYKGKEQDAWEVWDELLEKPVAELKGEELESVVEQSGAVGLLSQASLRSRAEWSTTIRQEGFEALLPYLNHMRGTANFLVARGRVRLAKGDVDG